MVLCLRKFAVFASRLVRLVGWLRMVAKPRGGSSSSLLDRQPVPPFYIYEHPALDFSWMRDRCAAFAQLRRQAYNERLGEVPMTHAHPHPHPKPNPNHPHPHPNPGGDDGPAQAGAAAHVATQ